MRSIKKSELLGLMAGLTSRYMQSLQALKLEPHQTALARSGYSAGMRAIVSQLENEGMFSRYMQSLQALKLEPHQVALARSGYTAGMRAIVTQLENEGMFRVEDDSQLDMFRGKR